MSRDRSGDEALIAYRMERARDSLRDANTLYEQNGSAAGVVNRAYYAMFYAALALLATLGKKASKHRGVITFFDEFFIKTKILPKEMSKFLHTAFDMRLTGDYEDKARISEPDAMEVLQSAAKSVKSIEEKFAQDS